MGTLPRRQLRLLFGASMYVCVWLLLIVFVAWMAAYHTLRRPFVDVRLKYNVRNSGAGKSAIEARSVYYAASESSLSDDQYRHNPDLQMFPVLATSAHFTCLFIYLKAPVDAINVRIIFLNVK